MRRNGRSIGDRACLFVSYFELKPFMRKVAIKVSVTDDITPAYFNYEWMDSRDTSVKFETV